MLADFINGTAEVTLRRPPPLERRLSIEPMDGGVALRDGDTLIAEARVASLSTNPPSPPTYEEASAAAKRGYEGRANLQYNSCFVCGLDRGPGDGLCIFPGHIDEGGNVAATWEPDASLVDEAGLVRPEFVWAALDCPSGFPFIRANELVLLGKLAAQQLAPVRQDARYVVRGWPTATDGRKLHSGSALYTEDGDLCAVAQATWIQLETRS